VAKLNRSGSGLVWSTYLGGDASDVGIGLDVDRHGNVVVTGETSSTGFPTTPGAFQRTFAGGPTDAFVTKLNAKGSGLLFSTFLGGQGGEGFDAGFISFFDRAGNVHVEGDTGSPDFPTTPGSFQPTFGGGPNDAWAAKLNKTGTALDYSTYLGGEGEEDVFDLTTDGSGSAYIPGQTSSTDFPVTPGAFQTTFQGGDLDGYLTKLNPTAPWPSTRPTWVGAASTLPGPSASTAAESPTSPGPPARPTSR
jgi:hypothetical protein